MNTRTIGAAQATFLTAEVPARAQQQAGEIFGKAIDQSSAVMPGVLVTLTSPILVGPDLRAARRAIERATTIPRGVIRLSVEALPRNRNRFEVEVDVSNLPGPAGEDPIDLVLAVTEDGLHTQVTCGENHGRTLIQDVVIREMVTVALAPAGGPAHATIRIAANWRRDNLKIVAFVQQRHDGRVVATAVAPLVQEMKR